MSDFDNPRAEALAKCCQEAMEIEREACAVIAENSRCWEGFSKERKQIAAAIRARS